MGYLVVSLEEAMSWGNERGWKHRHECRGCGDTTTCYNPSCTEPPLCEECRVYLSLIEQEDQQRS